MTIDRTIKETIEVDITSIYDVAVARNELRKLSASIEIPTILRARAAMVVSTIAELVLFKSQVEYPMLHLLILFIEQDGKQGVEMQCVAPFTSDIMKHFPVAEWQLNRICDDVAIVHDNAEDLITVHLWN